MAVRPHICDPEVQRGSRRRWPGGSAVGLSPVFLALLIATAGLSGCGGVWGDGDKAVQGSGLSADPARYIDDPQLDREQAVSTVIAEWVEPVLEKAEAAVGAFQGAVAELAEFGLKALEATPGAHSNTGGNHENGGSCSSTPSPAQRLDPEQVRFSFAVISDLNTEARCKLGFGKWLDPALDLINERKPAFVVGLGDLVAGGGDCEAMSSRSDPADLVEQLADLKEKVLEKLDVPFVPVSGNHDLTTHFSRSNSYPRRKWQEFWKENKTHVLPEAASKAARTSYRFTYKGVGVVVIGYYNSYGLTERELHWIQRNVERDDLVFRHINPYGVTVTSSGKPGYAIRDTGEDEYEELNTLLKNKDIEALFAGHTHGFYDGVCNGLRFVNTGSLADRSMEFLKGWERSPFRNTQAFVWVDVHKGGSLAVGFYVFDERCDCFDWFDKRRFPEKVVSRRIERDGYERGVDAECLSVRSFGGTDPEETADPEDAQ